MSISHLFPEEGPTLNLNFAGSRTLDPRITFTRTQTTSNGSTYTGRDGLIKYAGPNEPRFDHRYVNGEIESLGLLIEEQRVNSALRSQEFNLSPNLAVNASISPNSAIAPDGTLTADKLVEDNISSIYKRVQQGGFTVSGDYTVSFFVKEAGRYRGYIQLLNTTNASVSFNLQNGTASGIIPSRTKIEPYPNGWYRVSTSNTFNAGETPTVYIVMLDDTGNPTYIGDGSSGLFIWGLQVEAGAFPTSYIPTEGSTKTRTKDNASITGSNFTEWYNPSESTFFTTFRQIYNSSATVPSSTKHVIQAGNDITVNDNYTIRSGGSSTTWTALIRSASPSSLQFPAINGFGYLNSSTLYKASLSVDISLISLSLNGSLTADIPNTTTVNHTTPFNKLFIGSGTGGGPPYELTGHIAQLTYYPNRLPNSQLVSLTK
jgi:hypothetical protein